MLTRWIVEIMKSRKKKKKSDTGAKKVIWLTHGPGLSFCGISIPICAPESRFEYCQRRSHPSAFCRFSTGEIAFCGKLISSKFVCIASRRFLTWLTFDPNSYHQLSIPCEP